MSCRPVTLRNRRCEMTRVVLMCARTFMWNWIIFLTWIKALNLFAFQGPRVWGDSWTDLDYLSEGEHWSHRVGCTPVLAFGRKNLAVGE